MQYLIYLILGTLWGLYAVYCMQERNPNTWTLRLIWTFLINFAFWWVCVLIAVIGRFILGRSILIG